MSELQGYDFAAFGFDHHAVAAHHRQRLLEKIPSDLRVASWAEGKSFKELISATPEAQAILSRVRSELCERPATELVRAMQAGNVAVEDVTLAFLSVAALAHQATACLSDFFYEDALARARQLDAVPIDQRQEQLLFGLPMTIKGHMHLKGTGNQRGFVWDVLSPSSQLHPDLSEEHRRLLANQGQYLATHNAQIVDIFLAQGAIVIGKTTMPQSVMHLDTRSNLFGQTLNPTNLKLSPGGSSGGESAVLGCNGSALGIGTDIGGSVRHPCGVVGLYGLRPTCTRLPVGGTRSNMPGNESVGATCGPMARHASDVDLFMRAVLAAEPWKQDPACVRMPWRDLKADVSGTPPLRIGVIAHDGVVRPVAPVRRALNDVISSLKQSASVELKEVNVGGRHAEGWDLIRSLYFTDGGEVIRALASASGEPLLPLTQHILSEPAPPSPLNANEIWFRQADKDVFRAEYAHFFDQLGVDFLLTPVAASPAPRPEKIVYWGYTSIWNLVDYPSITFPSGNVADMRLDAEYDSCDGKDTSSSGRWDDWQRDEYENHKDDFNGAPICLQLVARRFHEEELLQGLQVIENILQMTNRC